MAVRRNKQQEIVRLCSELTAIGPGELSEEQKLVRMEEIRRLSPDAAAVLDRHLVGALAALAWESEERDRALAKIRDTVERLTAPPWHPATLLGWTEAEQGLSAMVQLGTHRRVVGVEAAMEGAVREAQVGDEMLLAHDSNIVLGLSPFPPPASGETAVFDRRLPNGELVLRSRDAELILTPAGPLRQEPLVAGDLVRWRPDLWMAFAKVERSRGEHRFLEETPRDTFEEIGGLDEAIERLKWLFLLRLEHAGVAQAYGVELARSVLLVGKPGNGKTKLARALANWVAGRMPQGRALFMHIKPSGLHSMWHGQSEANYREAFRVARETAEREGVPVVMFFDEVESSGAIRGRTVNQVDDRVAGSFMAELDGLEGRGNVFVLAATNRKDILDPAISRAGRLGDLELYIPRPGRDAGRAVLEKYITEDMPFERADDPAQIATLREQAIDAVVSRIYSPNASEDLCKLTLRSGAQRGVRPADLVSGALLARLAGAAAETACRREVSGGPRGLRVSDLLDAVDEVFRQGARHLAPHNCRHYLDGIPQDDDVMSVEPVRGRVERRHRYLRIA